MENLVEDKKKNTAPDVDGILAEQKAQAEQDLPAETVIPTSDRDLQAPRPQELAKTVAPADDYRDPAEDIARDDLWQAATDILPVPTAEEVRTDEPSGAPAEVLLDEKASADDYVQGFTGANLPGGLTEMKFATSAELDEEVETDRIQHFEGIPDYLAETISPVPIVVRIGDEFFCIEGWKMVEDARRRKHE